MLSGFEAGVSVDGPIASVSARVSLVGRVAVVGDVVVACAMGVGVISVVFGIDSAAGAEVVGSEVCAVEFAITGAAPVGGNVLISTGLEDNVSCAFSVRDPEGPCCGLLCAAVDG